jgi:hypothetical protein
MDKTNLSQNVMLKKKPNKCTVPHKKNNIQSGAKYSDIFTAGQNKIQKFLCQMKYRVSMSCVMSVHKIMTHAFQRNKL